MLFADVVVDAVDAWVQGVEEAVHGLFHFPDLRTRVGELGEAIDRHRKQRQELCPDLTITGMYNVLESTTPYRTPSREQQEAEEELLTRLVRLNAERAQEEARGLVRWLRPEYQNPGGRKGEQTSLVDGAAPARWKSRGAAPRGPRRCPSKFAPSAKPWPSSPVPPPPSKSRAPSSAPKPPASAKCSKRWKASAKSAAPKRACLQQARG